MGMGAFRFKELRTRIFASGIRHTELAAMIGKSAPYLSMRLNGHAAFDTEDIQKLADILEIPAADWLLVFFEIEPAVTIPDRPVKRYLRVGG